MLFMVKTSTFYWAMYSVFVYNVAVRTIVLSRHIVYFLGSRRMETAPTSVRVLLRPTQSQSDEPSDLRGSLSPTSRQRCTMS